MLRAFLLLSFSSLVPIAHSAEPVAWWGFNETQDGKALDSVGKVMDTIEGNYTPVDGLHGGAIRFDSFTTEITRPAEQVPELSGGFAVESQVAFAAYPWNWCALITQRIDRESGFSVDIGTNGELRLQVMIGDSWKICTTPPETIPLWQWKHLAASCDPESGIELFVDGKSVAKLEFEGQPVFAPEMNLKIGTNHVLEKPAHIHRDYGTLWTFFCLDGIIDELKLYNEPLSAKQVASLYTPIESKPDLPPRRLPSGPESADSFGAFYEHLKYYPEWDSLWRVGDHPDVVVTFDESPARVVFWRGTRYSPAWVSGNDLWMADQSVEAWNNTGGCYEHMQDRRCRYSHVRIIESNDARVVVHWRYAPTSAHDELWREDPKTGRACWVDEYYTIYPDAAGVRHVSWDEGSLGQPQQFQESLPLTHPGQYPHEVVEEDWVHIANYEGEVGHLSFVEKPSKKTKEGVPTKPTIQRYNFKSEQKPFICFEPGNDMKYLRDRHIRTIQNPGSCNHWPVGQAACDGRTSQAVDRPTHFCGFPISAPVKHLKDGRESWQGLYGMTEEDDMMHLVRLGRSWTMPAPITTTGCLISPSYKASERAYTMKLAPVAGPTTITLKGSRLNPIINPAFVLENWGDAGIQIKVDGEVLEEGPDLRIGQRKRLGGTDCILWLKMDQEDTVKIEVIRETP
ncbi:MAG: LamG-like jellyroll fold domain-containing protein [Akkermansiaceae bacterium]|nr:LamG-like jellyroll fold domain-containing protein [Akkermansiaceae bacterium]